MRIRTTKSLFILIGLVLTFSSSLADTNYCVAIRGNGELMPAHWGAMGRIVENWGMPKGMAGGSSAALTIFLMESVAANELVSELAGEDEKKLQAYQSLLIKSMQGYLEFLASQKEIQELQALVQSKEFMKLLAQLKGMGAVGSVSPEEMIQSRQSLFKHSDVLANVLDQLVNKYGDLVNPEFLDLIRESIDRINRLSFFTGNPAESQKAMKSIQFNLGEIRDAVVLFGNFNPWTDKHLFFRPGIIDFIGLSQLANRMANFFAGYGFDRKDKENLSAFLESCGEVSVGQPWEGSDGLNPSWKGREALNREDRSLCRGSLFGTLGKYRATLESNQWKFEGRNRISELVGRHVSSFISTSVIKGDSVKRFKELYKKYSEGLGFEVSQEMGDFRVSFKNELSFGYWGKASDLDYISKNLTSKNLYRSHNYRKDLKSQKFLSLGDDEWSVVLALSPAEPGLARIQPFPSKPQYLSETGEPRYLSAGGWSDLHPTLVLRAHGCENIIYLTRRDGESRFAQGTIHRLTDIQGVPVNKLSNSEKGKYYNNIGDKKDSSSQWSRLYNLAYSKSSYALSLREADGVYCTNWNSFDLRKGGWAPMIREAYESPFYVNEAYWSLPLPPEIFDTISEKHNDLIPAGYRKFVGCIPL